MFNAIFKILSICLLFISITSANSLDNQNKQKLQILALNFETNNSVITAYGKVLIHSPKYYITADKLIYDKNNSTFELFDNVNIIRNGINTTFSDYAFLDLSKEIDKLIPVLIIDNKNSIWINSKKSIRDKQFITLKSSTLSSCDCYDPAWSISFTSGDFNTTSQWLNTYNTTLFINEVPILYTPYFGFPTDTTRRSGLLQPTIGLSNTEGLLYAQPIYYAPKGNFDFEYIPQIRTRRGHGHELKYRYKNKTTSLLTADFGSFTENDRYTQKLKLKNNKHFGGDIIYSDSSVFSSKDTQDGLLISLHYLNDIDYVNTKYNNKASASNKLLESKIKYFYNTNMYYSDIDFKHYQNTSFTTKAERDTTMQEMPKINLHKYSSETFVDNLLYSANITFSNKTRQTGLKSKYTNMAIPFSYNLNLFDNYLNLSFVEQLNIVDIKYGNNNKKYENGKYMENQHILNLSTDLLKPYDNYIHTINFKMSATVPNIIKKDGDLYKITNNNSDLNIAPIATTQKNISSTLNHSIFDKENLSKIINHKINQSIIYDDNDNSKLSDLENELIFYYKFGTVSNRFLYNHDEKLIINSTTGINYKKDNNFLDIYYSEYKDKNSVTDLYKNMPSNRTIKYSLGTSFAKYYKLSYKEEYDFTNSISKVKEYVLNINKKCWAINFKLVDNLVASATLNKRAQRQNIIYMQFTLKPIVTLDQKYVQDIKEE